MSANKSDLADTYYFLAISKHLSFRKAASALGISASALSHSMKSLEERVGVRLFNRTTRSVTLTVAGEEFRNAISSPVDEIGHAFEALGRFRDKPAGRIRINVMVEAASRLLAPILPTLMSRYPDIEIEICADNRMVDIIEEGFDAGIRYGGTVPQDLIEQRVSADIRWMVVGAPDYFDRHGMPRHPEELHQHQCFRIRSGNDQIYHWEFDCGDESLAINAPGTITMDYYDAALPAVLRGAGLAYLSEAVVAPYLEQGLLKEAMPEWSSMGPPFCVYYPSRRQVPQAIRILIELLRELKPQGY